MHPLVQVALVELDINGGMSNGKGNQTVSQPILIIFAVCTTLLVSVHLLALMMSTCILPHMDSVTNLHSASAIRESPHVRLRWYIELSWFFSTVLGLLLFLLEIGIVIWLKFEHHSKMASYVTTALLLPVFVIFIVFAVTFYKKLFKHQLDRGEQKLQEMEHQMHLMNDIDFSNAHKSTIASRPDVDVEEVDERSNLANVASL